MYFILPELHY